MTMSKIIDIDKIISECIFNEDYKENPLVVTKKVIEHCTSLEKDINIDKLFELLCIIDTFYKSIGLMKILRKNKNYDECDTELEKYINNLFSNKKIFKKIKEINKANPTNLVNMIYKNFFEAKDDDLNEIYCKMNTLKKSIIKKIEEPVYVTIDNKKVLLNKDTFYSLQKKTKDANLRKEIERTYCEKSNRALNDFAELILLRHEYANELNYDTYFDYTKQKASLESIKQLIDDLTNKIEERSRKEIDRIHRELSKDCFNKKVDNNDIIHYYEKLKTVHMFKPIDVLRVLIDVSSNYFGILFSPCSYKSKLWSKKVMTCEVSFQGKKLGHVHFDMYSSKDKVGHTPLCVKISNSPTRLCLTTGYSDIKDKCMTYADVILLFREFGTVIQMITHDKNELIVKNDEYDVLMSQIMEYIAWEKKTIDKICNGLDKTVPDHIIFTRYINFAHSIKIRCINSLFDHILHNSTKLIDILEECQSQEDTKNAMGEIILLYYKSIYSEVMNPQRDILNVEIPGINPTIIYQEINGNEGKIYSSILTEIFSFAVYELIKNGKGVDFIRDVISKESFSLKENLHKFISQLEGDSYDLYLREIIGYSEIDTEINKNQKLKYKKSNDIITDTSAHHFYDDSEGEVHSESNDIIQLEGKRKLDIF